MCGIAGFLQSGQGVSAGMMSCTVNVMTDALKHRGPDDRGVWIDVNAGVALGHRRLSILDLSPTGHQPMISNSGRFVIVYNGEIYNFAELRSELASRGHRFHGHSDTEVMLSCFEEWGIEDSLKRFNGMFAFAVWDRQLRVLELARDPLGKKPLYYGWVGSTFLFGSELKSLRMHPDFDGRIDRDALSLYFRFNCIPVPFSIYQKFRKLPAASRLRVNTENVGIAESNHYWSIAQVAAEALGNPWTGTDQDAVDELERLLSDAVRVRSIADVPLGAFLSGGIDSSLVAALMQRQHSKPVRTFSVGLENSGLDEARHAEHVAHHLGTEHTSMCVTAEDAMATLPHLADIYDEPFSDSSQIPVYLVSRLARQSVTVVLSGDGGDEFFGGYNRHRWIGALWNYLGVVPRWFRTKGANALLRLSQDDWDRLYRFILPALPVTLQFSMPGYKMHKFARIAGAKSPEEIYMGLISHWGSTNNIVLGGGKYSVDSHVNCTLPLDLAQRMMLLDAMYYLHDDILVKVDRATMSLGLEARAPLLDKNVISFAWRLPLTHKFRDGISKWILRQVLQRYVPRELTDRPKSGFGIPLDEWLRGPLRDWAGSLLDPIRLRNSAYLDPKPIQQKWSEHLSGRLNWSYELWDVLMFESWLDQVDRNVDTRLNESVGC